MAKLYDVAALGPEANARLKRLISLRSRAEASGTPERALAVCSSSSCDLAAALQQLQQHDGDIRRLHISSSSFYLRMRHSSAAWCDIVHDGNDVDDGSVALKCSSML